jgi:hypothetical protein
MSLQYFEEKISFFQNVFLSFYLNIVCENALKESKNLFKFNNFPHMINREN